MAERRVERRQSLGGRLGTKLLEQAQALRERIGAQLERVKEWVREHFPDPLERLKAMARGRVTTALDLDELKARGRAANDQTRQRLHEMQAQEKRAALEQRQMGTGGYRDRSEEWLATPEGLRKTIERFNALAPEAKSQALTRMAKEPEFVRELQQAVKDAAREAVNSALKDLQRDIDRASKVLDDLQGLSLWRAAWQHATVALVAILITLLGMWWYVPSLSEIETRRAEVESAKGALSDLNRRGAKIKLRICGPQHRLCVPVDAEAGTFGDAAGVYAYNLGQV